MWTISKIHDTPRIVALITATASRQWTKIIAFDSPQEAADAGFHILYHDEVSGGAIYGKPLDPAFPKVCRVAVVFDAEKRQNL